MRALILKEFRELRRDRRTLAMLVVLPVILLIIFGYAANFSVDRVTAVIVGPEAKSLAAELAKSQVAKDNLKILAVHESEGAADAQRILREQSANSVIIASTPPEADAPLSARIRVSVDGSSLFTAQAAQGVYVKLVAEDAQARAAEAKTRIEQAVAQSTHARAEMQRFGQQLGAYQGALKQAIAKGGPIPAPPVPPAVADAGQFPQISAPNLDPKTFVTVLFNPDLKTSWVMVPGLIGLILLFIGALITSIGLVRERETGTLEQLAVMPLRPSAIIMGKITPYFLLAIVDMAVVTALGAWLFKVPFVGSIWVFGLAAIVFLFVVLGIGVLISSVSQNTGQAIQMAILFVVPQVLLSGLIFPLDSMPIGVRWIGYVLPLTWFREVAQGVMLRGAGLDTLWLPIAILAAMAIVAFGAATARMRRSLTHGGAR